jgi:hypothetical protein
MIIKRTMAAVAISTAVLVALPAHAVTGSVPLKTKEGHRSGCELELQSMRRVTNDGRANKRYVRAAINVECSRRAWPDGHVTIRIFGEGRCLRCASITRAMERWRHVESRLGGNVYSAQLECNSRHRRTSKWEYPEATLELWAWAAVFPEGYDPNSGQWHGGIVEDQTAIKC